MSPLPIKRSAPIMSRIVRESTPDETANEMRDGTLALISPVMTSTEGRWVGDDQVDPRRPRHLSQPADVVLHFVSGDQHQVGELIDDDDQVRHGSSSMAPASIPRL